MSQWFANVLALARRMFATEQFPEAPLQEPSRRRGPGFLSLLLGAESLPFDPLPSEASRAPRLPGAIFGREALPEDDAPPAPSGRPGLPAALFGGEALPEDPPGPPRRRGRWAAWLFGPERLD